MFCNNCGGPIEPNEKFCKHCGAKVQQKKEEYHYDYNYKGPQITFDQISNQDPYQNSYSYAPVGKSRILAAILALITNFGIYNFYLGFKKKAIIQLIITLVGLTFSISADLVLSTYGQGIFYYICVGLYVASSLTVGVWGIVDAIRLFTRNIKYDGNGNPLI